MTRTERIHYLLDTKTRRWWFFVGLVLLVCLVPPYASRNFSLDKWGEIIAYTLDHSLWSACQPVFPIFQGMAMVFVVSILVLGNWVGRIFCLYAGISYVLFAVVQGIAISPRYGVSMMTVNLLMMMLVAGGWFWEALVRRSDFSRRRASGWQYLVFIPAGLAFWCPVGEKTGLPDFHLSHFLTSGSALTFCLSTPVFVAVLLYFYPRVNTLTLRIMGAVGVIIALFNVIPKLVLRVASTWWDGVLHLPLLGLCLLAVILSFRRGCSLPDKTRDCHGQGKR